MSDIPDIQTLHSAARKLVLKAKDKGKLSSLTPIGVLGALEAKFDLEEGSLNAKPYKSPLKKTIRAAADEAADDSDFMEVDDSPAPKNKTRKPSIKKISKPVYKSAEFVPTSEPEPDEDDDQPPQKSSNKSTVKPKVSEPPKKSQQNVVPSEESADESTDLFGSPVKSKPAVQKQQEKRAAASSSKRKLSDDEENSDSEVSQPKRKKTSKGSKLTSKNTAEKKPRASKSTKENPDKDSLTIKRLKSFVVACGVRKVWSKVFAGVDSPSGQIKILKGILADLGMNGRLSMEQAKAIKEKREMAKELEDVKAFAEAHTRRSTKAVSKSEPEESEEESEDEEENVVKGVKARKVLARDRIRAFLADQSDSE